MESIKRYLIISCEILFREVCFCASKSKHIIDVAFQKKGLHDIGEAEMSKELQKVINQVDYDKYSAILLCYGLCNNGVRNLHAPIPMVIPRAHDCITLLLGSKEKYSEYFANNIGTFFHSSGWLERDMHPNETDGSITQKLGIDKSYINYVEEYGEENAEYIMSIVGNWLVNYKKVAFINNGIGDIKGNREKSIEFAKNKNWDYEEVEGDINLIERLVNGEWDESDFLIIPPNHKIESTNDPDILRSCIHSVSTPP